MRLQVGDLVRHNDYGVGCVVKVSKANLEINGQSFWYEIQWAAGPPYPTIQWAPSLEKVYESR